MSENENAQPDMEQVYDQGGLAADGPLTGAVADEADTEAETIIPPEQPPMDDAAGGPSINENDDSFEENETLQVQGGE